MRATAPHETPEHEFEPQYGLPERLPPDERLLWQGAPDWRVLARHVFLADKAAIWLAVMLALRFGTTLADGEGPVAALRSIAWLAPLFALGVALLVLLAWFTARTTVYTLTDRRLVMRIGIVLTVAYNLPLSRLEGADLRPGRDGFGDIALTLEQPTRIAWLHLWPHVRPWHVARPQPMLRSLPDAEAVARRLADAWSVANGNAARSWRSAAAAAEPERPPQGLATPQS
jgi:hypothetical protein